MAKASSYLLPQVGAATTYFNISRSWAQFVNFIANYAQLIGALFPFIVFINLNILKMISKLLKNKLLRLPHRPPQLRQ